MPQPQWNTHSGCRCQEDRGCRDEDDGGRDVRQRGADQQAWRAVFRAGQGKTDGGYGPGDDGHGYCRGGGEDQVRAKPPGLGSGWASPVPDFDVHPVMAGLAEWPI